MNFLFGVNRIRLRSSRPFGFREKIVHETGTLFLSVEINPLKLLFTLIIIREIARIGCGFRRSGPWDPRPLSKAGRSGKRS